MNRDTENESMTLRAGLEDVAGIGPFFAASGNPAEVVDPSWRPLRELYTDPEPVSGRIAQVGEALGLAAQNPGMDRRVAASIAYQGLVARLVSPLLAVASVHCLVPPWSPDTVHWRPSAVGPWPLWESAEYAERPGDLAGAVAAVLVEPHLMALAAMVRSIVAVSERTLRGNAASAVVAAGKLIARARPPAAARAYRMVTGLLANGPLAGSGSLGPEWSFRRTSCCLYYRVPSGGTCGDCVLAR